MRSTVTTRCAAIPAARVRMIARLITHMTAVAARGEQLRVIHTLERIPRSGVVTSIAGIR